MCAVTEGAVFGHWGMLPNKGSTFVRVALIARLIDGRPKELSRPGGVMDTVTGVAIHLTLVKGMRERLESRVALLRMTVVTNLRLAAGRHDGVVDCVALVAIGAGHLVAVVGIVRPTDPDLALVTRQTHAVLQTCA